MHYFLLIPLFFVFFKIIINFHFFLVLLSETRNILNISTTTAANNSENTAIGEEKTTNS